VKALGCVELFIGRQRTTAGEQIATAQLGRMAGASRFSSEDVLRWMPMRMVLAATTRRIVAVFGRDITFREAKVSFGAPNSWQAWEAQVASNNPEEIEGAVTFGDHSGLTIAWQIHNTATPLPITYGCS